MTKTKITEESTESEASTALVEMPTSEVSLTSALHASTRFAHTMHYGTEDMKASRRLSWCTGNNEAFAANGKTPLPAARGWYIDQPNRDELFPDDFELIGAMEALCEQYLASECVVVHYEKTGEPRKVLSWHLMLASLFVICEGIPSQAEMTDAKCRWGIAYGWNPKENRTELHLQCFVKELADAGYQGIFTAKFTGHCTEKALRTLRAQEYVLKFADSLRERAGMKEPLPYYAFALPTQCSIETYTAGREKGKTTQIYYPVPCITRLSQRTPEMLERSLEYLSSVAISTDQAYLLEYDGRVERTAEWSVEKTKQIMAGDDAADEAPADGMVHLSETPF